MRGDHVADKTLTAHLRVTGENAVKKGLKDVGDEADKTGTKFTDLGKDTGFLAKQAKEAEAEVQRLVKALNETGDLNLVKQIKKQNRQVRLFDGLKKQLEGEVQEVTGFLGSLIGEGLAKGIGAALAKAGPVAFGGLAAAAATTLPFIGGVVAAAVLGGVGSGGIAGGIALAAQDSSVRAAAEDFAKNVGPAFTVAGEPFTKPVIEALHLLQGEAGGVAVDLRDAFSSLAPELLPFTQGLVGLVKEALPGFIKGLEASKPVLRVIASELPPIGRAVGDFIEIVGEDTDGAVLAWQAFSRILQGSLRLTGQLIANLSQMFEWSVRAAAATSGVVEDIIGWVPLVGGIWENTNNRAETMLRILDEMNRSTGGLGTTTQAVTVVTYGFGVAAGVTADQLEAQRLAMQNIVDLELGMVSGTIAVERALDSFTEAIEENGKSLDIRDEAGRRNTETIVRGVQAVLEAAQAEYDLAIAHGATAQEAEEAAKTYRDKYGKALEDAAIKAYGNSAALQALLDKLDKLDGKRVTYTLVQRGGVTVGAKVDGGFIPAGFEGRASGGPVEPHRMYRVNESGIEFLQTGSEGGYVLNAGQTAAMMSGQSGGAARPVVNLTLQPSGDAAMSALLQALWPHILRQIKSDGGDLTAFGAA